MWYNTITKEIRMNAPWGNTYYSARRKKIMFPNWKQITQEELEQILQQEENPVENA